MMIPGRATSLNGWIDTPEFGAAVYARICS